MTTQEYFDMAYEFYLDGKQVVDKLTQLGGHTVADSLDAQSQYDVMVQWVLLNVALADGNFSEVEGAFIDTIIDTYSILYLFGEADSTHNWQFAGRFIKTEDIRKVIAKLERPAREHILNFAATFATLEAERQENVLDRLFEDMRKLVSCFVMCDGKGTEQEVAVAVKTLNSCLVRPWRKFASLLS